MCVIIRVAIRIYTAGCDVFPSKTFGPGRFGWDISTSVVSYNERERIVSDETERMTPFFIFLAVILAIQGKICSDCMVILLYFARVLL